MKRKELRYQPGQDHSLDTSGRAVAHWSMVAFVALCAGACAMAIFRGPELLTWANGLWDKGP